MLITAKGRLQHHFWGVYAATITLEFANAQLATLALPSLPGFKQGPDPSNADLVGFHGTGEALKAAEATLVALGANRSKMTSLKFSIDYGEPFTVSIDLTPVDPNPPVQQSLLED